MIYQSCFKRIVDILLAMTGLLLSSPLILLITILIKAESKGPVLFKQQRIGYKKRSFTILKFRTMTVNAPKEVATHLLESSDSYITKVGRFLRKSSLDEIPQLINILKGDMSLVGPRPALWNQFDLIAERDKYGVHDSVPGLTGWAQINGRDVLPIEEKARLDGEYVQNICFSFDMDIFLKTLHITLKQEGIKE